MLTVVNIALVLVNLYSVGVSEKKIEIIEEKLADMAMLEARVKHICDNLDSVFR